VDDIQHFRQLIRNAVKEYKDKVANPDAQPKTGKTASRKLFLGIKKYYGADS